MRQQKYFNNSRQKRYVGNRRDADLLISSANKAHMLVTLMVLADKFDFMTEQLQKFVEEYNKQLMAYNDGYVEKASDFEKVLWEEHGMRIGL